MNRDKILLIIIGFASIYGGWSCLAAERNIRIPSDATSGGSLAVRVTYPENPLLYRFPEGGPVMVMSPGGHQPGGLSGGELYVDYGFIVVTFLYPGGSEGPFASDGVYDYRGENCVLALRDVIRYAMGSHMDILGNAIRDIIPGNVLTDHIGIVSSSNGGPSTLVALSIHSADLAGVRYLVFMESPTSDQTVNGDLGAISFDCDTDFDGDGNGLPGDDGKNIRYLQYGPSSCSVDYSTLVYDSQEIRQYEDPALVYPSVELPGVVILDNNQNGMLDYVGTPPCYDMNGNGVMDEGDDYVFSGKVTFSGPGAVKIFLSTEVTEAAQAMNLFGGSWPDHIATLQESVDFWQVRDATLHFDSVAAAFPDLAVMHVFTQTDHVQQADDHPHIQQGYDGFRRNGIWCRLNPDASYVAYTSGGSTPVETMDTDANVPVMPGEMKNFANPDSINATLAAVCEMTDRVHFGVWEENLEGILTGGTPTPSASPTPSPTWTPAPADWPPVYIVSMMHAEESLPFHQDETLFRNYADNLRQLSALLAAHGAKLDFGPDWTFIEGIKQWDPALLTDLLAAGHGVHTHAHETQFDLGAVNAKLLEAGLNENIVANGGFLQTGPGGTNWVGYQAAFTDFQNNPLFQISVGYKNPQTQIADGTGVAFRPSQTGDWHVPDPQGPIIYIGSNMPDQQPGGGVLNFSTIRNWMNTILTQVDPNRVNTLYWHDSLHNYATCEVAAARMAQWEILLTEYLDPLVQEGRIQWRNFTEIGAIYTAVEQTPNPTPAVTPTSTATPTPMLCPNTRVTLWMPAHEFETGDSCGCRVTVCNGNTDPMTGYPLFVILDVMGVFLFAPDFTPEMNTYLQQYPQFPTGATEVTVIPEFTWPEGTGTAQNIYWYAALTNPAMTQITGEWDSWEFQW